MGKKSKRKKKKNHRGRSNSGKREETNQITQEETPSVPVWPGRFKQKKEYVIKQTNNPPDTPPEEHTITPETTTNVPNETPSTETIIQPPIETSNTV